MSRKPNFVSLFCQAFEGTHLSNDYCSSMFKLLKLSFPHQMAFSVALALSNESAVQQQGANCPLTLDHQRGVVQQQQGSNY